MTDTPKWLTKEEKSQIEQWLDSGATPNGKYGSHHRLVIAIMYESGLRVSEIIGDADSYSPHPGLLHKQANFHAGKWLDVKRLKRKEDVRIAALIGPRTRRIYNQMFSDALDTHQALAELMNNGAIFPAAYNRHLVYQFCRRLGNRLGISNLHPHRLRHTAGRDVQERTGDPSLVQKALGHAKMSTAMIYAEASNEQGLDALRKVRGE